MIAIRWRVKRNGNLSRWPFWDIWHEDEGVCVRIAIIGITSTKYVHETFEAHHTEETWPKFVNKFTRRKADRIIDNMHLAILAALKSTKDNKSYNEYIARADIIQTTTDKLLNPPPVIIYGEEIDI